MKHMLNTLYVTQAESRLSKEGETVVVMKDDVKLMQIPIHTIGQIICFGYTIYVTPPLMAFCAENGISIVWLSESGKFLGRVEGAVKGNVLLRREQYRWADLPDKTLEVARNIVAAKVNNSRINLLRWQRNHPAEDESVSFQIYKLADILGRISECADIDKLRGLEGEAANSYFSVFDKLILQQKNYFQFSGRNRRPPRDPVNALLSFVYTLLVSDVRSSLESVGLDPYVGYLHVDRPGRPSLALDIMEEFRPAFADRLVLNLINLKQIQSGDFESESSEIRMNAEGRKKVIVAYQNRKREELEHPFLNEKMEIGIVFLCQARLLSRFIRGDIGFYPAMVWR
ncbi:MAG TPA: type I-C CRISPR-associated endonuclease Cas1c [bacterium]|nr:type I-C CRISPR-associated endonuclease Cas1c [bacterium]HPG84435.1 type I-C CRISPR-associated endonuclease Cas1c [bacterium]